MNDLASVIEIAAGILKSVDPSSISVENLQAAQMALEQLMDGEFNKIMIITERKDDDADEVNEPANESIQLATMLNRKADVFNDELDRIKQIRKTINLEALDPLILTGRKFVHSIYNYTASLQK